MSKYTPAIYHGDFVNFLMSAMVDDKPLPSSFINDATLKTRGGVAPEGGTPAVLNILDSFDIGRPGQFKEIWIRKLNPVDVLNQATDGAAIIKPKYRFGAASLAEQKGVKPELLSVANLAIQYSRIDFCFYDGVRTYKEQLANLNAGTTQTMKSKHLPQADGFGHAMDLVPWIGGKPVWDWEGCYEIALAVDRAATERGFASHIRWGAAWDRVLSDYGGDVSAYRQAVEDYKRRHAGKDFIDGPHFEWVA